MPIRSNGVGGAENERLDREAVRRILSRAAVEQHRLDRARAESYSLAELEEMAAEAGISAEALRAAVAADRAGALAAGERGAILRPHGWVDAFESLLPRGWSRPTKRAALAGAGGVAVVGLLTAFPAIGAALFWGTVIALIVFALLVAIGVLPF